MYLIDEQGEQVLDALCTCHTIREGADGVTFSDAILGVLCGHCESLMAEAEAQAEWEAMGPAERAVITWRSVAYRMPARRPGAPVRDDPWFSF
jgi:hypothetical protein